MIGSFSHYELERLAILGSSIPEGVYMTVQGMQQHS